MPDVHAGAGCVIGFTADLGNKVIPNIVGVDIGCGMLTVELGNIYIDFAELDEVINTFVPSGFNVHEHIGAPTPYIDELRCYDALKNVDHIKKSLGTLGGGNHFIEIDVDDEDNKYLIIHSGSRNLGKQVADHYQKMAIQHIYDDNREIRNNVIRTYKEMGREKEISDVLSKFPIPNIEKDLCYLEDNNRLDYLHDMVICQCFAAHNRAKIAEQILSQMRWKEESHFETIHNYIELKTNMVRKGAVSAKQGERVLIPMNMRDGCIIGVGKGNEDWNCSAPHGAGRLMSRKRAKESIDIVDFKESMVGIYTTSVDVSTLDESPMAYKPVDEIISHIGDTVEIERIIKPIYNYKAKE